MSLATSSGIGGMSGGMASGGLTMAHQANAIARPAAAPPPPTGSIPGASAPPVSAAGLGADLLDKNQLSLKQVRNTSHLPLVAVDLFNTVPHVAMFPPKPEDPSVGTPPVLVGKMKSSIYMRPTESSHKTLRKYLTRSKGYEALLSDTIANADGDDVVVVNRPQDFLGLRRLSDAPDFLTEGVSKESASPAIAEEASQELGASMTDSTLDGSPPQDDDFDRVVCKVRLHVAKKALTLLPEEAVQMLFYEAQRHTAKKAKVESEVEGEEAESFPFAVAVPAWMCHDASIEALQEAFIGDGGVIFQRSVCALAGSLLPGKEGKPNPILDEINKFRASAHKAHQKKLIQDPDATFVDNTPVVLCGLTDNGVECTAVLLSSLQPSNLTCLFGDINVIGSVAYQTNDPLSMIEKCMKELRSNLKKSSPELATPAAVVSYGSPSQQNAITAKFNDMKSGSGTWAKIPHFAARADSVAMGTAILGAVSHGRLSKVVQVPGKKPKAAFAINVQNVAPCAVGISMNYHGGDKKKWTTVKTVFDFDRRVPAGPYPLDLKASECVVHREGSKNLSDEDFLKAAKKIEGSRGIPRREEAALAFSIQIFQKWTRSGEWKKVGDSKKPLVITDKDENETACEHSVLELSLGSTGVITVESYGERESVVQATKSAINSSLRFWAGVAFSLLFFGGFLVKSWWEESVFERDTKRLLAYYKHVIPGSMQDGDLNNARYLVWKYRGKKDKLWRSLEKKYGEPVLHANEWNDDDYESEEEEVQNLDEASDDPLEENAESRNQEPDL